MAGLDSHFRSRQSHLIRITSLKRHRESTPVNLTEPSLTTFAGRYLAKDERDGLGDVSRERIEAQWQPARLYDDDDPGKPHAMWETFISNSAVWYWTP
jgi:hypothetical protein